MKENKQSPRTSALLSIIPGLGQFKNGQKVKGGIFVPLKKTFEFDLTAKSPEQTAKLINKVFKVKKGVTQITFEGEFIESGAAVTATEDDLTDDIKDLIDCGVYTLEEALAKCSTNGGRERKMMILKPQIRMVGDDDNKTPQIQKFDEISVSAGKLGRSVRLKREDLVKLVKGSYIKVER